MKKILQDVSQSSPCTCLLGQHGRSSKTQWPVEISENILQNIFHNMAPQTVKAEYWMFPPNWFYNPWEVETFFISALNP